MARRTPKYQKQVESAGEPEPPRKQIPADIAQQAPHTSWGGVPLFYEDITIRCVDCGGAEVWTAEQQKWWYETAKGYIFSTAIRCRACREKLRARHGGTPRRSHQERLDGEQEA